MSNRGLYLGDGQPGYQDFDTRLVAFYQAGTPTQPAIGDGNIWSRFFVKPNGLVHFYGAVEFGSTSTYGASESVWGIELPVEANRSSGGADIPIGSAWCRKALANDPCPTMSLVPTLMDPIPGGWHGHQTHEDKYMQFFLPYLLSYGTGTITATTGNTFSHGLGNAAYGYTPNAADVQVIYTENPTTGPGAHYVSATSTTQVTLGVKTDPGASDLDYAWKVKSEPNSSVQFSLLVSQGHPWSFASGHVIGWNVEYEARR